MAIVVTVVALGLRGVGAGVRPVGVLRRHRNPRSRGSGGPRAERPQGSGLPPSRLCGGNARGRICVGLLDSGDRPAGVGSAIGPVRGVRAVMRRHPRAGRYRRADSSRRAGVCSPTAATAGADGSGVCRAGRHHRQRWPRSHCSPSAKVFQQSRWQPTSLPRRWSRSSLSRDSWSQSSPGSPYPGLRYWHLVRPFPPGGFSIAGASTQTPDTEDHRNPCRWW